MPKSTGINTHLELEQADIVLGLSRDDGMYPSATVIKDRDDRSKLDTLVAAKMILDDIIEYEAWKANGHKLPPKKGKNLRKDDIMNALFLSFKKGLDHATTLHSTGSIQLDTNVEAKEAYSELTKIFEDLKDGNIHI